MGGSRSPGYRTRRRGRLPRCTRALLSVLVIPACAMTERPTRTTAAGQCPIADRAPNNTRPILAIHHAPSLTAERYEAVVRNLTNGRERLESLGDGGLHGLLVHVAGQGTD